MKIQRYGYKPDPFDWRDKPALVRVRARVPAKVDLRTTKVPAIYDQDQLGSCTANAIARLHEYRQLQQGEASFTPSRLAIYFDERKIEGSVNSDAGAYIRDGMKVVHNLGVAPESLWPYEINRFMSAPPQNYYAEALNHQSVLYARLPGTLIAMKSALVAEMPFTVGFSVPENFESSECANTGMLYFPTPTEAVIGGHAVAVFGYDDTIVFKAPGRLTRKGAFIVANSWGTSWGNAGYFYMPYAFITKRLANDFWTLGAVE